MQTTHTSDGPVSSRSRHRLFSIFFLLYPTSPASATSPNLTSITSNHRSHFLESLTHRKVQPSRATEMKMICTNFLTHN